MYSSYPAETVTRAYEVADRHGVNLDGTLTWAFEFEDQPFFAGFRALATQGIDLPVLNVFRLFSRMDGGRLGATSSGSRDLDDILKNGVRAAPDVSVLATRAGSRINVLVLHYHDDDVPGPAAAVTLGLDGLSPRTSELRLVQYSVDHDHSNAFTAWQAMGSPPQPTPAQYAQLEAAGKLGTVSEAPAGVAVDHGKAAYSFTLARQGVALLVFEEVLGADGGSGPAGR